METIQNYLDNVFSALPKSTEVLNLKNEIKNNMEDKYNELKQEGKSENEAIGIVISEFGNIDELMKELGINPEAPSNDLNNLPVINSAEAGNYLSTIKHTSFLISIGVFLCMLGASSIIFLHAFLNNYDNNGFIVIPLLICVAAAVCLFIYSNSLKEKYKLIEDGDFVISDSAKKSLENNYNNLKSKSTLYISSGVCICILSPILIFAGSAHGDIYAEYCTSAALILIASAVCLFIKASSIKSSHEKILQLKEYALNNRQNRKTISIATSIFWPSVVIIYLFISFVFKIWDISWIVFPIAGISFGIFSSVYTAVKAK